MRYVYVTSGSNNNNIKTKEEIKLANFLHQLRTTNKKKLFIKDSGIPVLHYMGGNAKSNLEQYLSINDAIRSCNYFCGKDNGKLKTIPIDNMAFSQDILNVLTVRKYYRKPRIEPITVLEYQNCYFCSNGTHRAFSRMLRGDTTIPAIVYHCPIEPLYNEDEVKCKLSEIVREQG